MCLYVRQERVNRTAAEQSPCGCDLYVRGPEGVAHCGPLATEISYLYARILLLGNYSAALLGAHTLGSYR